MCISTADYRVTFTGASLPTEKLAFVSTGFRSNYEMHQLRTVQTRAVVSYGICSN